jgi:peptidoglycan/xylan/chitin deacetylase (PgdA/CDA1 family)
MLLKQRDIFDGHWNGVKSVCLSFDCDYPEDIEACKPLIELLLAEEIPASFAVPGYIAKTSSNIIEEIIENKYEIVNHTLSHFPNFRNMSSDDIRVEIEGLQDFMMRTYNYVPKGFRTPHGLRKMTPELFKILKEKEMYDSSLVGYGVTYINGVLEIPLTPCPEHSLIAFDSYHHFRFPLFSSSEDKVLRLWGLLLQRNNFLNIFLDPRDLTTRTRLRMLEQMIKRAKESGFTFNPMNEVYKKLNNS